MQTLKRTALGWVPIEPSGVIWGWPPDYAQAVKDYWISMASETSTGSGGAPIGNQNRANQYRIKRTLESLLDEASSKREGLTKLQSACQALLDKAEEGDTAAFREAADRVDGKVTQGVDVGSDPARPALLHITNTIVDPRHTDS